MPNPLDPNERSSYLEYLPAIFQQDSVEGRPNFLGRYLLAFEQVLTGLGNPQSPGLEEILNGIAPVSGASTLRGVHRYFEPGADIDLNGGTPKTYTSGERAPAEYLEWLSGWVALSLRADLSERQQRNFIAHAIPLYRLRGTLDGLRKVLSVYTNEAEVVINDFTDDNSAPGRPHYFHVTISLQDVDVEELLRQEKIATAIIDLEKPAHTIYELEIHAPAMQVGVEGRCNVGRSTYLAPPPNSIINI